MGKGVVCENSDVRKIEISNFIRDHELYLYTRYPIVTRRAWLAECVARSKVSCIQELYYFNLFDFKIEHFYREKPLHLNAVVQSPTNTNYY